jgi:hypothetical protein
MNDAVRRESLIDEGIPHSDPLMTIQAQMRETLHGCMCTQMCFIVPCTRLTTGVHSFINCKKSGYMLLHLEQIQCVPTERFDSPPAAFHL